MKGKIVIDLAAEYPDMTLRQRDVCLLLLHGHSNKEIAIILDISPRTVEDHRLQIIRKVGSTRANGLNHAILSRWFDVCVGTNENDYHYNKKRRTHAPAADRHE